jgi:hypothetical protein
MFLGVRRGLMQDYANQIAQMFIGYQITLVDLPRLLAVRHGQIKVDLFGGQTTLGGETVPPFSISDAVRSWYGDALQRDELDVSFIRQISITCDFDIVESKQGADSERLVIFDCQVDLEAESGRWSGKSHKSEQWRKSGDQPWEVRDV